MREEDVRVTGAPGGNLDKRMEGFREKRRKVGWLSRGKDEG